ncbi:hypothetical protein JHK87_012258 [Glycine soja]|nr:hypothetical protein JHK87_012258 [Glycine soja]
MEVEGSSKKTIVMQQKEIAEARVPLSYRDQLRANFEFISKLSVDFWCFHDKDIAYEGKTLVTFSSSGTRSLWELLDPDIKSLLGCTLTPFQNKRRVSQDIIA